MPSVPHIQSGRSVVMGRSWALNPGALPPRVEATRSAPRISRGRRARLLRIPKAPSEAQTFW